MEKFNSAQECNSLYKKNITKKWLITIAIIFANYFLYDNKKYNSLIKTITAR